LLVTGTDTSTRCSIRCIWLWRRRFRSRCKHLLLLLSWFLSL